MAGIDQSRTNMLIKVAQLYYQSGLNQNEIAQQINISRSCVSKLLVEAKEQGIVNISIRNPLEAETEMESAIREHFHLRSVLIAETKLEDSITNAVAQKAAMYLDSIIKSGDTIAAGWGRTMFMMARHLRRRDDLSGIRTASLYGQQAFMTENVFNTESVTLITRAFNAISYVLAAPVYISSPEIQRLLLREKSIQKTMEVAKEANIAIYTIGTPDRSSFLDQPNGLTEDQIRDLVAQGMVTEVCLHLINRDGTLSAPDLEKRLMALPLEDLQQKEYRIAVASGRYKAEAVYTALVHGHMNVLVTDEEIAKSIIQRINNDRK